MNRGILQELGILAKYYKNTGDAWRTQAYQKAIISIRNMDQEITDISQVKGVKGIGKGTLNKIQEYLDTGEIEKVEEVKGKLKELTKKSEKEQVLELFQEVWGIGPAKAKDLYNLGMRSLADLRKNKDLLTKNQRTGLKYYKDLLQKIPRDYIDIFQLAMHTVIAYEFGLDSFRMEIAGSYRRGDAQSRDIDCLITSKKFDLKKLVDVLCRWGMVTDILSMRGEKFMGIAQCPDGKWYHFRLDIEFIPEDEYGSTLLYFTGSKGFNVAMRADAKRQGYTLNQHGLFDIKKGNRIPVFTEREIMEFLGMRYVPPERR